MRRFFTKRNYNIQRMALKIGIVGLPNVGKSTLFQAITKKQVDTSNYPFATIDPNVGVVAVPDPRLQKLTELSRSKKTVPASIEFVDIAGLVAGAHEGEGLGNQFLSHIREVDAIVEVVRAFENKDIHHVSGRINPEEDASIIETELILADLATAEKAASRAEKDAKSGSAKEKKKALFYKRVEEALAAGKLALTISPEDEDEKIFLRDLQLLSAKPIIFLINSTEPEATTTQDLVKKFGENHTLTLNIKLEDEIAQMGDDAGEFAAMSRIDTLISKAYETLGLITFLTTGEDETRAWPIPKHSTAPRAGRAIHSDFEDKFIRAEIVSYDNLVKTGSYAKARELGLLQTKGKDYVVQDGDIIEFKI